MLKLSDELVSALSRSDGLKMMVGLDPDDPQNNFLKVNGCSVPMTCAAETQRVEVVRSTGGGGELQIVGRIVEKFAVRQELAASTVESLRQQTIDAERARLARKTLTLEDDRPNTSNKTQKSFCSRKSAVQRIPSSRNLTGARSHFCGTIIPPMDESLRQSSSERDTNSQNSWSPSIADHAFSTTAQAAMPKLRRSPAELAVKERKPADASLIPPRPRSSSKTDSYHQLEEEFGRRYGEYVALSRWMDERLDVFKQLRADLEASLSAEHQQQLIFKLIVEDRRLKDDREYHEKMELLEECHASLLMIKSRLASLAKAV